MSTRTDLVETLSPRASAREDGLPPLLILLTVVTGVVDAVAYLRLGHVFEHRAERHHVVAFRRDVGVR